MCVFSSVKSYLFCLSANIALIIFCFESFFLAVTEHKGPAAPLHTDAPIVYREEEEEEGPSDKADSHHFLSGPPAPAISSSRMD